MRKSRRDSDWDDMFRSFDDDLDVMRERMDRLMEAAMKGMGDDQLVYGFSMRTGPDGRPVVQEFGNVPGSDGLPDPGCREPLTDITEEGDRVKVIVELPGVEREDIDLRSEGTDLSISVDTKRKRFCKHLELPCEVLADSATAEFRNGVLTVTLDKMPEKPRGIKINVG